MLSKLLFLALTLTSLASPTWAQDGQEFVAGRHGIGYTFEPDSFVISTAITGYAREPNGQHEVVQLPNECFSQPGVTGVSGIDEIEDVDHFFRIVFALATRNYNVNVECGDTSTPARVYLEIQNSAGDWLIHNAPTDKYLRSLTNGWLSHVYNDDDGFNTRSLSEDTLRVTFSGDDEFGFLPHQGWFYAVILTDDDKVQENMVNGLVQLGYTAQVGTGIDETPTVIVRLKEIDTSDFYTSLRNSSPFARELVLVKRSISTLLAEAPLLLQYENRTLKDKYGANWLTDDIKSNFSMTQ